MGRGGTGWGEQPEENGGGGARLAPGLGRPGARRPGSPLRTVRPGVGLRDLRLSECGGRLAPPLAHSPALPGALPLPGGRGRGPGAGSRGGRPGAAQRLPRPPGRSQLGGGTL